MGKVRGVMVATYSGDGSTPHGHLPHPKAQPLSAPWLLAVYAGLGLACFGAGFSFAASNLLGWTPLSALLTLGAAAGGLLLLGVLSEVR